MLKRKRKYIVMENFYGIGITDYAVFATFDKWKFNPHSHDHVEIFIQLEGSTDVYVEKNIYRLSGNEIRVYAPGEIHSAKLISDQRIHWYQISIPIAFFEAENNAVLGDVIFNREPGTNNVFITKHYNTIVNLIEEAFAAKEDENPLWEHYASTAIVRLLCFINEKKSNVESCGQQSKALKKAMDVVNADFRTLTSLDDMAAATYYSPSYLTKIFKQELNTTPYKFLIKKKLNESKKALKAGMSIEDACEYAGFSNYANFITLFRKHFNITPKKYRDNHDSYVAEQIENAHIIKNPMKTLDNPIQLQK